MIKKAAAVLLLAAAVVAAALPSAWGAQAAAGAVRLRIAYNPMPFNLPSIVEHEWELLKQEGVDAEYTSFTVGYAMSEAMASGGLDIAPAMGLTSAIVARAGGRDLRIIGVYSQAPAAFGLAVRPGTRSLSNLKGARIAVPVGTEAHVLLAKILAEQGLTARDVQLVNMLIPDGMAALQSGHVDAAMVVEPVMSRMQAAGQIEVLRDGTGLIQGMTVTVVPGRLVGTAAVELFERAHQASLQMIEENPKAVLQAAAGVLNLAPELVEQMFSKYHFTRAITPEVRQEIEDTIAFLTEEGIIARPVAIDELLAGYKN